MNQHHKPHRHTLLPLYSSATLNSQPLSLSTISCALFLSFSSLQSLPFFLSDSHLLLLLLASHGDYISWKKRWQRQMKKCLATTEISQGIQSWPQFSACFLHFLLLLPKKNFKELWERQGSGRLVNIRGHLEILQHQRSLLNVCQSMCYDWKSVRDKTWWDSAALSHFPAGLMWHSSDSQTGSQKGKTRTFYFQFMKLYLLLSAVLQVLTVQHSLKSEIRSESQLLLLGIHGVTSRSCVFLEPKRLSMCFSLK